ncbi:ABC transporter substrate-binding protein [Peptoniphilus sp. AGMB00490]|uniref:ABC transporter substrate-binding protein n=1 Tax=Peptoniphilus faecalis TaxID=2731255 RepID=A0A848RCH0_9FIRM|nr:ABC transporter substrate-binding protein [Peptoniphilus faecalis]NMW84520.1 ABC transporter substrate-binding protein [Peptoniphilus faecalis]
MKKILLVLSLLLLVGCAKGEKGESASSGDDVLKIGILQFAQHPSLDNCREGLIEGLKEEGFVEGKNLKIDYQNAQADMGISAQIANSFVSNKVDMIIAIATPAAMSAYNATLNTDIPVVYTALSDPVAAQVADENKNPVGNITGTSDILPVEEQLKMIREILPDAKNIGILHTSSEANSDSMLKIYKDLAGKYNFKIVDEAINTTADIPLATDNILSKVDAITNLLDNTVVNSLPTILDKANEKKIPVFGSEIEQVKMGCLGSEGIEYISLGNQTGKMASKILKGEKEAKEMPYETILEPNLYLNSKVAENLGIKIPKDLLDRAVENFSEINLAEGK